jgi:Zn ribbon nucleic-acid-binding protein
MSGLAGLNRLLWPIRYKPLPDELLSCWFIRLAHGHGLKVQTFSNLLFGQRRQVWNRDVDRLGSPWLIEELSLRTGTPFEVAERTCIRTLEGTLFSSFKLSGTLPWVLSMGMYHRKRTAFGMQYCPTCLATDQVPYYRRTWRLAFMTVCPTHEVMLHDRCPQCASPLSFHRAEMGRGGLDDALEMVMCHACGMDLRQSPVQPVKAYSSEIHDWLLTMAAGGVNALELDDWNVMRHLSRLIVTDVSHLKLHQHLCRKIGAPEWPIPEGRVSIELCELELRHHLSQLIGYLMLDLQGGIEDAWRSRAIRFNHMLKDFKNAPPSYERVVSRFMHWRDRL